MNLTGATINFMGDSITAFSEEGKLSYVDVMVKEYGLKKANNYAIGGSRLAKQKNGYLDWDCCGRIHDMDKDADAVVIWAGTNDCSSGDAPLGSPADRTPATFWGACHYIMNAVMNDFAGKPILVISPMHCGTELNYNECSSAPLTVYRDILMAVAEYYALPVLDMYTESLLQPANATCRERLMPDSLHPNDAGHTMIAHRVAHALEEL